jgi:hypothetical protein
MSCGGCHQNSNDTEIAPNVNWPKSQSFVHVDEQGNLSPALTLAIIRGCAFASPIRITPRRD